jgi:hypothetical protein
VTEEPAVIGILREALEGELPDSMASRVLFAALSAWGGRVPGTFVEVLDVVQGPLRQVLAAELGGDRARAVVRTLENRLRFSEMPTGLVATLPKGAFEDPPTAAIPKAAGPVSLKVIAKTPTLAALVVSVLGPARVMVTDEPAILLIDASDPPGAWAADLEARAKQSTLTVVYGTDLPEAAPLLSRLHAAGVSYLGFSTAHGAAPILDLIRSRAG